MLPSFVFLRNTPHDYFLTRILQFKYTFYSFCRSNNLLIYPATEKQQMPNN